MSEQTAIWRPWHWLFEILTQVPGHPIATELCRYPRNQSLWERFVVKVCQEAYMEEEMASRMVP